MKLEDLLAAGFDLEDNSEPIEQVTLDVNLVKAKIPEHSSKKLCEMIVCDRYLGFNREIAILCMEELSNRRLAGDDFNFEDYIDQAMKELPPLDFSGGFDIRSMLSQVIKK